MLVGLVWASCVVLHDSWCGGDQVSSNTTVGDAGAVVVQKNHAIEIDCYLTVSKVNVSVCLSRNPVWMNQYIKPPGNRIDPS